MIGLQGVDIFIYFIKALFLFINIGTLGQRRVLSGCLSLQTYEQWKEALPDSKFLEGLLPSQEDLDSIRASLISYRDKIKDAVPEFSLGKDAVRFL